MTDLLQESRTLTDFPILFVVRTRVTRATFLRLKLVSTVIHETYCVRVHREFPICNFHVNTFYKLHHISLRRVRVTRAYPAYS
jgi:hypothetical protein